MWLFCGVFFLCRVKDVSENGLCAILWLSISFGLCVLRHCLWNCIYCAAGLYSPNFIYCAAGMYSPNCIYYAAGMYSPTYFLPEHWTEVNGKPALNALRRRSDRVAPRAGPVPLVKVRGSGTPGIELGFFDSLANNLIIILTELRRLGVSSVRKRMGLRESDVLMCCGLPNSTQGRG